jgi:hypothetical protein
MLKLRIVVGHRQKRSQCRLSFLYTIDVESLSRFNGKPVQLRMRETRPSSVGAAEFRSVRECAPI